jgi:hypothetical protein
MQAGVSSGTPYYLRVPLLCMIQDNINLFLVVNQEKLRKIVNIFGPKYRKSSGIAKPTAIITCNR